MVGIGEYTELVENPDINDYVLNTNYNSIIRYYEDLASGKLLSVIPYNLYISKHIISCNFINENREEILLIASIKNKLHDTTTAEEHK